jgi:hypothetical protein
MALKSPATNQMSRLLLHPWAVYASIRHNLLYKIWVDWPGVYTDTWYSKYKRSRRKLKEGKKEKKK